MLICSFQESLISLALPLMTIILFSMQKGISLFNRKPSKGIEFLISTKKIGGSPADVASFLRNNTTGLNETMIGDYLGEREEFPLKVMHAYVDSFNFKGMDFGEAIRFFLRGFKLPGEAQKIDRIMEKFAERYCKCSPNSFTSADTAYVLAYSVIMLNTDAHNSMVKDKVRSITCTFWVMLCHLFSYESTWIECSDIFVSSLSSSFIGCCFPRCGLCCKVISQEVLILVVIKWSNPFLHGNIINLCSILFFFWR